MTDATAEADGVDKKASKMPLILGVIAALIGAGGGFFAVFSGMLLAPPPPEETQEAIVEIAPLPDVAYVPIEPMVVSIGPLANQHHLRFHAQLEVPKQYRAEVEAVLPRIVDIINGYLRAVELEDLEDNLALHRFRSHLLQRIAIVAGRGRVNDLLFMEFVLN